MRQLLKHKIITVLLLPIFLLTQVPVAHAIISPIISEQIDTVRDHVVQARSKNGTGSLKEVWGFIFKEDKKQIKKSQKENTIDAFSPDLSSYIRKVRKKSRSDSVVDAFSLILGTWLDGNGIISTCLRDDIWELEDLKDDVLAQVFKAAVIFDRKTASQLWEDWQRLSDIIFQMKIYYKTGTGSSPFFKEGTPDYYKFNECPKGEFKDAIKDFIQSFKNFGQAFCHVPPAKWVKNGCDTVNDWGSLKTAIKAQSRREAQRWIRSNQFRLRLGGKEGGNPTPLFRDGEYRSDNLAGTSNDAVRAWNLSEKMVDDSRKSFGATFDKQANTPFLEIASKLNAESKKYTADLKIARQMATFNLSLNTVGENTIRNVSNQIFKINSTIKQGYEESCDDCVSLPTFNKKILEQITKNQCSL